ILNFYINNFSTTIFNSLSLHVALPIFVVFFLVGQFFTEVKGVHFLVFVNTQNQSIALGIYDDKLLRMKAKNTPGHTADIQKQALDRKSTRLNSSHVKISYAVFCLKKKR